jgi:hypothetical protein
MASDESPAFREEGFSNIRQRREGDVYLTRGCAGCAHLFASTSRPRFRRLELDFTPTTPLRPPESTNSTPLHSPTTRNLISRDGSNRSLAHPRALRASHPAPDTQPQAPRCRRLHLDLPIPQSRARQRRQCAPQLARRRLLPTDLQTAVLRYQASVCV